MDKGGRQLGRRMMAVYRQLQEPLEKYAADNNTTCRKGCASCCNLLVYISLPEAVAIAEKVLEDPARTADVLRKCYEQIQKLHLDADKYFRQAVPCMFLDESKACTVYDVRPMPCRHHYVVSPPEDCSPLVDGKTIVRLNTQKADVFVTQESLRVSKQRQIPLLLAPIPVAVMWATKLLTEGEAAFMRALETEEDLGLMDIRGWTQHAFNRVSLPVVSEGELESGNAGSTTEGGAGLAGEGQGSAEGAGESRP